MIDLLIALVIQGLDDCFDLLFEIGFRGACLLIMVLTLL